MKARMAKLVDALASGASLCKKVGVRVSLRAQVKQYFQLKIIQFFIETKKRGYCYQKQTPPYPTAQKQ